MTTEQQLPEGWEYVPFNMFFNVVSISDKKISQKEYLDNGKYPVIDQGNLFIGGYSNDESLILKISSPVIVFGDHTKCFKYVSFPFVAGADGIKVLEPQNGIYPKYAYYYCLSIDLTDRGYSRHFAFLKKCQFLIVPIETQQAIVNKIESLFDEIDEGIGRLKTAARQIQQYRQSLLKNAFNGELTKEWRSKHADALPSENELLAQIQTTREQHHAQQLADWQTAVSQWEQNGKEGKKPSKPILKKITTNISDNEINVPDKHWFVGLFGDLVDIKSNLVKPDEYLDFPHIAPDNIEKNTGKLLSFKTIREDEVISPKHYFYAGQIIYSKIRPNLSKLVLVDFNGLCSADMYPLESDVFNHSFLKYIMLSRYFVKKASTAGSRSVLPKINQSELDMIPLPICSPAEQTQIVTILESKLTACDQLADELAKQLKQAELLKQAVLKAAFQGELSE